MDIVEKFIPKRTGRVLDVGCGDFSVGGLLYCDQRLRKNYEVFGIDLNPGKRENVLQASGMNIPFADNSIEYVVSLDVIEHIQDFSSVIIDILRVTKRRAIIIVPSTSKPIVRKIINMVRRILGGADSNLGQFLLQGHFYEFFPREILSFKGRAFKTKFLKINYPLLGASLLHRSGLIFAGIYVFDRINVLNPDQDT
ncbi:MAG: class I SAM-dependent methyltransferase [Candidatus Hodarchaeales archaeon]|jgi:ubiquinone/menaquinone biosynthesis C-methylase UbiE